MPTVVHHAPQMKNWRNIISISRDLVLPLLGVAALIVVSLITFTWEMLSAMSLLYIALLPFGIRSYRRHKAEYERRKAEG